ncbi:MAG: hypothetical protein IT168_19925 [Bryobacterales bacterium]|nr:hypothetical protein [Bryobacterales bacterium]
MFQFLPNFRAGRANGPPGAIVVPDYAGFVPGMVGLFQINFRAPTPPGPLASCQEFDSNVSVYFVGTLPIDIPFCMAQ